MALVAARLVWAVVNNNGGVGPRLFVVGAAAGGYLIVRSVAIPLRVRVAAPMPKRKSS